MLRKIGISMRDSQLDMRNFGDVLDELADKWSSLDEVSKNALATAFAGTRQRESFLILMENYDKYQNLLDVSRGAKGTATSKYKAYQESYQAAQNRLTAGWEGFTQSRGYIKLITKLTDLTADIVEWLPEIARWLRRFAVNFVGRKAGDKIGSAVYNLLNGGGFGGGNGPISALVSLGANIGSGAVSGWKEAWGRGGSLPRRLWSSVGHGFLGAFGQGAQNRVGAVTAPRLSLFEKARQFIGGVGSPTAAASEGDPLFSRLRSGEQGYVFGFDKRGNPVVRKQRFGYTVSDVKYNQRISRKFNTQSWGDMTWGQKQRFGAVSGVNGSMLVGDKRIGYDNAGNLVQYNQDGTVASTAVSDADAAAFNQQQAQAVAKKAAASKAAAAAAGISAGIQAGANIANAMLQSYDTYRVYNDKTGKWEQVESSAAGSKAQRTSNVLATTFLGSTLGGLVGDWIGRSIAEAEDKKSGRTAARKTTKEGAAALQGINTFGDTLKTISTTVKKGFDSVEEYQETKKELDTMLTELMKEDNEEGRKALYKAMEGSGYKTLTDLSNALLSSNKTTREQALRAAQVAQAEAKADATRKSKAEELLNLQQRRTEAANSLTSQKSDGWSRFWSALAGAGMGAAAGAGAGAIAGSVVPGLGTAVGAIGGAIAGGIVGLIGGLSSEFIEVSEHINSDLDDVSQAIKESTPEEALQLTQERLAEYREKLENPELADEERSAYESMIGYLADTADELNDIKNQTELIYREINMEYARAAIQSAKTDDAIAGVMSGRSVLDLTNGELKRMSKEDLYRVIGTSLEASGGIGGIGGGVFTRDGKLTAEAEDLIASAVKEDPRLYSLINGSVYTLNEALGLSEGEIKAQALASFAKALGTTVEQLDSFTKKWGNVKLADMLASPSDLRSKISDLVSLFTSMASASGLTGENLEKIIDQFPELIQYLGNVKDLQGEIFNSVRLYEELYSKAIFEKIADSEGYFDQFKVKLEQAIGPEAMKELLPKLGSAQTFNDILGILARDAASQGIDPQVHEAMKELYTEMFAFDIDNTIEKDIINTVIQYQTKMYDLAINNLEQQKNALSQINSEREYEINLIKAKIALEDAQKQKKRVWREGVGWTYETNQAAIAEAEKNLEEVTNQKKIAALEMEIEQLSSEKQGLENISMREELENLRTAYESWAEEMNLSNGSQAEILQTIRDYYTEISKINLADYSAQALHSAETAVTQTEKELIEQWSKVIDAREALTKIINSPDFDPASQAYIDAYNNYMSERNKFSGMWTDAANSNEINPESFGGEDNGEMRGTANNTSSFDSQNLTSPVQGFSLNWGSDSKSLRGEVGKGAGVKPEHFQHIYEDAAGKGEAAYWNVNYDKESGRYVSNQNSPVNISKEQMGQYSDLGKWAEDHHNTVIVGYHGDDEYAFSDGRGDLHAIREYAEGTLGVPSLLNEEGVEAIVTPGGTIATLPSATGVVPADITKNLWSLGALAPAILRAVGGARDVKVQRDASLFGNDNSLTVGVVNMTVNPDANWSVDDWVKDLKVAADLNRRR